MFLDKKTVLKIWLNLGPRYQNFFRARVLGYFWGVRRRANQRVAILAGKKRSGTLPFVYIIQFLSVSFLFFFTAQWHLPKYPNLLSVVSFMIIKIFSLVFSVAVTPSVKAA